jgi:hypothetical protein
MWGGRSWPRLYGEAVYLDLSGWDVRERQR